MDFHATTHVAATHAAERPGTLTVKASGGGSSLLADHDGHMKAGLDHRSSMIHKGQSVPVPHAAASSTSVSWLHQKMGAFSKSLHKQTPPLTSNFAPIAILEAIQTSSAASSPQTPHLRQDGTSADIRGTSSRVVDAVDAVAHTLPGVHVAVLSSKNSFTPR